MPTLPQPSDDTAAAAAELTRRKVEAEIAKLNAETEVLWAQRRASLHRTVTLIVALVPVVATVMTTLFSIRSSYDARRLALETEARQQESSRAEIDTRILTAYATEILPRLAGRMKTHISAACFDSYIKEHPSDGGDKASVHCSGGVPISGTEQLAGEIAAIEMATRYPLLCRATRAALSDSRSAQIQSLLSELSCHVR